MSAKRIVTQASPSLALVKYWGKHDRTRNLPATPSLAVTLKGLNTTTEVIADERDDQVTIGGKQQAPSRYIDFFSYVRKRFAIREFFHVTSDNSFPTSAGLASSSSGFAALALACSRFSARKPSMQAISEVARLGSASAARAVYGGFTLLRARGTFAVELEDEHYWPEFRIVVVVTKAEEKKLSSREAMERSRTTSPYYRSWLKDSAQVLALATEGLKHKDMQKLGEAAVLSYTRMFATMLSSSPPFLYWIPGTLSVIRTVAELRNEGIGAWETMDAGPQVKIMCLDNDVEPVCNAINNVLPGAGIIVASPGPCARVVEES